MSDNVDLRDPRQGPGPNAVEQGVKGVLALNDPAERARLFELPERRTVMLLAVASSLVFITVMTLIFAAVGGSAAKPRPPAAAGGAAGAAAAQAPAAADGKAAVHESGLSAERLGIMLLDYPSKHFPYPLTIQNFMHVLFFIGLGELFIRWRVGEREMGFIKRHYLPEDEETVLQFADLGPIRRQVSKAFDGEHGFLPSLIDISILQFQASRSVDQAVSVMNNALELIAHRVELRYGLLRFIAWMIPTVGFIGTVYGLGASLYEAGAAAEIDVQTTARTLGVGFDCTMVALIQSAILVFAMHLVQEKEETAVNLSGGYCLRNLINRLYTGTGAS
jgi:biopolymer transport protein ExbB/TolQ